MANHINKLFVHTGTHGGGRGIQVECMVCNTSWQEFIPSGNTIKSTLNGVKCPTCNITGRLIY